jgi:hypothetical protein
LHGLSPYIQSVLPRQVSVQDLIAPSDPKMPAGISLVEYEKLAKTDPDAYQKMWQSHLAEQERSEIDKLMNFFARGKYE